MLCGLGAFLNVWQVFITVVHPDWPNSVSQTFHQSDRCRGERGGICDCVRREHQSTEEEVYIICFMKKQNKDVKYSAGGSKI